MIYRIKLANPTMPSQFINSIKVTNDWNYLNAEPNFGAFRDRVLVEKAMNIRDFENKQKEIEEEMRKKRVEVMAKRTIEKQQSSVFISRRKELFTMTQKEVASLFKTHFPSDTTTTVKADRIDKILKKEFQN